MFLFDVSHLTPGEGHFRTGEGALVGVWQAGLAFPAEGVIVVINLFCFCILTGCSSEKQFLILSGNVCPLLVVTGVLLGRMLTSEEAQ